MARRAAQDLGETLAAASPAPSRIQLCGRLAVTLAGKRVEASLPGRQGRLLFAFLCLNRRRAVCRETLMRALWAEDQPSAADAGLNALLAKSRKALGEGVIGGKQEIRLVLPPGAWVDVEAAQEALHRAESAIALADWAGSWGPSRVVLHVCLRSFLPGHEAPWIDETRVRLERMLLAAHECVAICGLHMGGPELPSAERSARALIALAPFRETGYHMLMQVLEAGGNVAEALLLYEQLRNRLREEFGALPGPATQAIQRRLLRNR